MPADFGIYCHIPFCLAKCDYCDFYSLAPSPVDMPGMVERYLNALRKDIQAQSVRMRNVSCDTVYFGGGTPGVLTDNHLQEIIAAIRSSFSIRSDAEITIELNPDTVNVERVRHLRHLGFNRFSLGVQTFQSDVRRALGRRTGAINPDVLTDIISAAGNCSCDLITGVPGQTLQMALDDAARLIACGPQHVSLYMLTIEEGTPLALRYRMTETLELQQLEQYEAVRALLGRAGYEQYEISAFARPGWRSRHNIKYWTWAPFLGLGAGAHGFVNGARYYHPRDIETYCVDPENSLIAERVSIDDQASEFILSCLRYFPGFSLDTFAEYFGDQAREKLIEQARKILDEGLVEIVADDVPVFRLTEKGIMFADSIVEQLTAEFLR